MRKKTDPEIPLEPPIMLGNKSNGEFFWTQTPRERKMRDMILRLSDERARRLGMDRRDFLASALGMATSLYVVNLASGCGDDDGGFNVGKGPIECDQATEMLSGDEFILDLQTHHIEDEETWRDRHPGEVYGGDQFANFITFWDCSPRDAHCIGPQTYLEQVLMNSETTVAVLSGFPSEICDDDTLCTNLNSNEGMAYWRDTFNEAAGSQRMVQHCQVAPNDQWDRQITMMERIREQYGNHGWKCYPPWGPRPDRTGWWLDDEAIGSPFIEKCIELGEPLICVHKGFPFSPSWVEHSDPRDVGPAAVRYPDVDFIIYHSAIDPGAQAEGPYDPDNGGIDRLIRTVEEHDLKGKNVYAEMGSAWAILMNNAVAAQHYVGKILKHLGEDNLVWGSECVWFGSPQPQIEAFRTLEISEEFQATYGYPALTPEIKAKIFGLTGARLYGIDPDEVRCTLDTDKLMLAKRHLDSELGDRRWAFQKPLGPRTRRKFARLQNWRNFLNKPA
jgi:predicted TIM-barrel fold metal-dependent hydrolase